MQFLTRFFLTAITVAAGASVVAPRAAAADPTQIGGAALSADDLPPGFSELGATESGRSLFAKFPEAATLDALIQKIGDGLGKTLDAKPVFTNACVDSKSRGKGVASFTGKWKNQDVNGVVMFGVDPQTGSTATIVYSRTDAPQADIDTLMATLPARAKMQTYHFPDGSGTIDLPPGWEAKTQSLTAGAWMIAGPRNQLIIWNAKTVIDTPDSFRVKIAHQNYESSVRLWNLNGRRGPAPIPLEQRLAYLLISPYLSPETAFKTIMPMLADRARAEGKPWVEYGNITASSKADSNPLIPGAEAAVLTFAAVVHNGDKTTKPSRQLVRVDTFPNGQTWAMVQSEYIAPDSTFDRDLPTMVDIVNSAALSDGAMERQFKKDDQAFQAVMAQSAANHEALMRRGRDFIANQDDRFHRQQRLVQAQAKARHDANSDTQEMALGLRDVYDRQTGEMHRVNLYDANGIVNSLNTAANDPNRFVQVPLRYER